MYRLLGMDELSELMYLNKSEREFGGHDGIIVMCLSDSDTS